MNPLDTQDRRDFVAGLDLPAPAGRPAAAAWTRYVAASLVATFGTAPRARDVQDVLNSTLLAWLAATKKTDPMKDPSTWYAEYRSVLDRVGWVVEAFTFSPFNPRQAFTLRDVIAARGDPSDVATVEVLAGLPANAPAVLTFDRDSHDAYACAFHTGSVTRATDGLTARLTSYTVSTTVEIADPVLSFEFTPATTQVATSTQQIRLNEKVYATAREAVQEKLGYVTCRYLHELGG